MAASLHHRRAEQAHDAETEGVARDDEVGAVLRVQPAHGTVPRVLGLALVTAVPDGLVRAVAQSVEQLCT